MNSAKQIDAERPRHVAPTSRSGFRERPQWVALRGRSGSIVLSSRDRHASDLGVSLWPSRSGLRERPGVVALIGRSGSVFGFHRDEMASDSSRSLQRGRSERSERFGKFLCLVFLHMVFNQMVLIFQLDMFFRSGTDFGRFMGSLLKYNALEDFSEVREVLWKTSWKSSSALYFRRFPRRLSISLPKSSKIKCARRLPGRLPRSLMTVSSSISSGVQACLCR
ncbi:hypothetical protein F2Q68_00005382 [Brassica cretica]|uniref:Uncharacterized protein n=1 Tax=Brassica cretica TaxID=69181 RepID=A0A8S9JAK4_BRACR|nr:hypothetical protein F2Q68_00005382 [Brassica cretica]